MKTIFIYINFSFNYSNSSTPKNQLPDSEVNKSKPLTKQINITEVDKDILNKAIHLMEQLITVNNNFTINKHDFGSKDFSSIPNNSTTRFYILLFYCLKIIMSFYTYSFRRLNVFTGEHNQINILST